MASKFQNRLVGTVILVAIGVIVLPGLLDGKKKHYKEEFAAIPLVPKPDDQQDSEMVPPVTQPLPAQPPEGAGTAQTPDNAKVSGSASNGSAQPAQNSEPTLVTPPPVHQQAKPTEQPKPKVVEQPKPKPVEQPKPKPVEQPKPKVVETPKQVEQPKAVETPKQSEPEAAPSGQAFVVQLGALKNAAKVSEIVAQLRLSGYRAFTVPSSPVQGQITRIYVGPDASKAKLQSSLSELQSISGLGGVVKPYGTR
ncbi:cell division protein DedD [Pantoea rodasii]|uniref:Cell division protein DedD n=1 Tax=Pantoea rodasii TaxID=1076549 RepID=A0A2M9WGA9_9GAMM|nr:cell division protein DedD [Pantoea rodasii]ORM63133.1 cell division protein DedD [Pantoea rodasii]PJZ06602.1 cell division protein DedD [Pantoea rodasii]